MSALPVLPVPATVLRAARSAAATYSLDLHLLLAILYVESRFNVLAVGDLDRGVSLGLGQLNLRGAGAAYRGEPHLLMHAAVNTDAAARYLRACLDAYPDDEARSVAAYNAGIGGVAGSDWREINWTGYVVPVQAILQQLRAEGYEEDWDPNVRNDFRQYGKCWQDVAINLLGVCNDALEAGRIERGSLEDIARQATEAAARWGAR